MPEGATRKTLAKPAEAKLEEKKSVFIADATPVASETEAREFIETVRKKYSDAKHHVYAYVISDGNIARYTDDGEPQGTGGIPMLGAIKQSGASDLCVVVSRYFGGVLLGTGGLARAYGGAARLAIEEAGIATFEEYTLFEVSVDYSDYQRVQRPMLSIGAAEESVAFGENVTVIYSILSPDGESLRATVTEITSGRATVAEKGKCEKARKSC